MSDQHNKQDKYLESAIKINPAIEALEKAGESTVVITGFIGTSKGEVVRLYATLDVSSYVEIPKEAIIYLEADKEGEPGVARAFVRSAHFLLNVQQSRVRAADYKIGPLPRLKTRLQACQESCEARFSQGATRYFIALTRALQELNPVRQNLLLAQAGELKEEAKRALYNCLTECARLHGVSWGGIPPSIERIYQDILVRYYMDDAEEDNNQ